MEISHHEPADTTVTAYNAPFGGPAVIILDTDGATVYPDHSFLPAGG